MSACASENEATGIVVRVDAGKAWIEVERAGCGQCASPGGCGGGLLGLGGRPREYCLPNTIGARTGDAVVVSVAGGQVLRGALLAYLMPLGLGLLAAAAITLSGSGDGLVAAGLLGGIALGLGMLRRQMLRREPAAGFALKARSASDSPPSTKESQQ